MKFLLQVRFNGADKVIGALPAEEQKKVTANSRRSAAHRACSTATSSGPRARRRRSA